MSWIEAVFISTKVTMLSVAVSERLRRFISRMAAIPSGVAALPMPMKLAAMQATASSLPASQ